MGRPPSHLRISHLTTPDPENTCMFCRGGYFGRGMVLIETEKRDRYICFRCARQIRNITLWLDERNWRARALRHVRKCIELTAPGDG